MASPIDQAYNDLQEIKKAQAEAQKTYQSYVSGAATLPFQLKEGIQAKLDYNKPLIEQENALVAEQKTTPFDYAAELKGGRFAGNPILAGQAAARRQAQIDQRLANIRGIRAERTGTINDVIGAATASYQSRTDAAKSNLDAIRDRYAITAQEWEQLNQNEKDRLNREIQQEQFRAQQDLDERKFKESIRQFNITSAKSGGSGSGTAGERTANKKSVALQEALARLQSKMQVNFKLPTGAGIKQVPTSGMATLSNYEDELRKYASAFPGDVLEFFTVAPPERLLNANDAAAIRSAYIEKLPAQKNSGAVTTEDILNLLNNPSK